MLSSVCAFQSKNIQSKDLHMGLDENRKEISVQEIDILVYNCAVPKRLVFQ